MFIGATLWWMFIAGRYDAPFQEIEIESQKENSKEIYAIAQGLVIPWSLDFLPDGRIVFTERPGRVRIIDQKGRLLPEPILILGDVAAVGEGGLLGIAVHPKFFENSFIYLYYTASQGDGTIVNRVARYRFFEERLVLSMVIIDRIPAAENHDGGRIAFGPDEMLYITTGDAGVKDNAQNVRSLAGKILRVQDNGAIPTDNPFSGSPVWSYGHRNPQGIAWDRFGKLWATEHGQSAKDEINIIIPGQNYGWPTGSGDEVPSGTTAPVRHSADATWAPSGAAILGDALLFAGLRGQELYALTLTKDGVEGELRSYFGKKFGRIRSVSIGPDGFLYLLTSNRDGRGIPKQEDDQIIRIHSSMLEKNP